VHPITIQLASKLKMAQYKQFAAKSPNNNPENAASNQKRGNNAANNNRNKGAL
jgi:hypothetical protein